MNDDGWEFWIDVGGTFTDCIAKSPDGSIQRCKTLSSGVVKGRIHRRTDRDSIFDASFSDDVDDFWNDWTVTIVRPDGFAVMRTKVRSFRSATGFQLLDSLDEGLERCVFELSSNEPAPLVAIRTLLGLKLSDPLPDASIRLGTTRGTNALLTRTGARTAVLTTQGFADTWEIGYQNRPQLFALDIRKPSPLYKSVIEVDERMDASGQVVKSLNESQLLVQLGNLLDSGIDSLAICLLNAYANPVHEQQAQTLARRVGFSEISVSHEVSPLAKIVSRGDTTIVDAYLNPVLRSYARQIGEQLSSGRSKLRCMTSSGGLVSNESFSGKDSILSGPAGGVVGFAKVAESCGFTHAIGFDMGGTSTDVARYDGRFETEFETEKAGVRISAPMLAIHTVAAGGGSICGFDGIMQTVGPESAGANPGPACYGRGGPLTVTDVNLFLGKLLPDRFPFVLNRAAVEERLKQLQQQISSETDDHIGLNQIASGFLAIANSNMAQAIREISVSKGFDVRDYVLVCFGGAGGQHACAVASELGIEKILIHPDAGILSALGIGHANTARYVTRPIYRRHSTVQQKLPELFLEIQEQAINQLIVEGVSRKEIRIRPMVEARYQGTESTLILDYEEAWVKRFAEQHKRRFGYIHKNRELEIVSIRIEGSSTAEHELKPSRSLEGRRVPHENRCPIWFDETSRETVILDRTNLNPGDQFSGPALVTEELATTLVDPGWNAQVLSQGEILMTAVHQKPRLISTTKRDPVMLEIFNRSFEAIARQMGITLQKTAISTNVKERLDYSCAIFTSCGDLVVNAPHIPVHLGAMSETVKAVLKDHPNLQAGDVVVTNNPYRGGSHLPDVTVVTPVHDTRDKLLFFTASRAHHAEIGGITPGSMPPFSTNLEEEGVLIRSMKLVERGRSRLDRLAEVLQGGRFPSRDVASNLADITAQIAANQYGANDLLSLIDRYSANVVDAYMHHIQDAAEAKMRSALSAFQDGVYSFTDQLDDGARICVAITIQNDEAVVDFTGTDPVLNTNLNANRAIVTAAILYVFRCLINAPIPLNQGVLKPITIRLPICFLNPPAADDPSKCAAIVGGNVETSQRIVDVLLGALGLAAASQGTMNNFLFGDDTFGYYETICGGAGATPNTPGAHAVHTHMTNTRLTDPEVMEQRYPVRVKRFCVRKRSGGAGKNRGGDGVIREIEFLQRLNVSLLTQRRRIPPFGLSNGQPGAVGINIVHRANDSVETLDSSANFHVRPGDRITIETPGGGGFGPMQD